MTTLGMDTAAGLAASSELDQGSQQIAALATRLDGVLRSFDWQGTDAERTFETWGNSERPALDSTVAHLAAIATLIRQEAQAQDAASGTGAAAGTVVTGTPQTTAAPAAFPTVAGGGGPLGFLGRIGERIGAVLDGAKRTLGHAGDFVGKLADVVTGREDHSVAEIAASALLTGGSAVGTVVNAVTGKDERWFAEGPGLAGTPVAVPPGGDGQFQPPLRQPTDLPSLMQSVTDSYQVGEGPGSNGDVRITQVDNGSGRPTYVVSVPGTERWGPDAGSMPRDLSANLNLVAGNPTAAAESVTRAMEAAGILPGSQVLMVGHSQGGIIAGQLASDPAFVERFGVTNVLTYGAPIDHMQLAPGVSALQVQHGADIVPRLDLGGIDAGGTNPNTPVQTVTLGSPGGLFDPVTNHSHVAYRDSVAAALGSDTEAGRILRDYQASLAPFFSSTGHSTAVDVPVSRGQ
ncbi:hypothetical protein GCM10023340_01840 [Nocardioides marinquilinus]|uniref:Alpha/beta hydrolase n=1 Tax=Nocardioides marinquilinus TaxID=1210400 RepID=A0ABP9P618_9ACTN